jgi:phage baseplate assembly protein W
MNQISYPYQVDGRGRTAAATSDDHIRHMIEQVLFTDPGERVNRPDFGAGVRQFLFAPGNDEVAAAAEFLIRGALQQWLGDLIKVEAVQVHAPAADSSLRIVIQYVNQRDQQRKVIELNQ